MGAQGQTDGLFPTQRVLGIIESNVHRRGDLRNPVTELIGQKLRALRGLNEPADRCSRGIGGDELAQGKQAQCLALHLFFTDQSAFHEGLNSGVCSRDSHIKVQSRPEHRSSQLQLQVHRDASGKVIDVREQRIQCCAGGVGGGNIELGVVRIAFP